MLYNAHISLDAVLGFDIEIKAKSKEEAEAKLNAGEFEIPADMQEVVDKARELGFNVEINGLLGGVIFPCFPKERE